jgi:alkanesulfonate monooxygenase SsuD/methylene tetrahydromethanopterin reductase-like flavin-dependent oxidoreductase (luciferase family)
MIDGQGTASWERWLELAQAVEARRARGLFAADHYLAPGRSTDGSLETWAVLAALAARTGGSARTMVPVTFRHASVARRAPHRRRISSGQAELGIGAGWFEASTTSYFRSRLASGSWLAPSSPRSPMGDADDVWRSRSNSRGADHQRAREAAP